MTQISILPIPEENALLFEAVAENKYSRGRTAGEALDLLTAQFTEENAGFLIVMASRQPDNFWTAQQQERLQELTERWKQARDAGKPLIAALQKELETLTEAEVNASAARAAFLAGKAGR